MKAMGYAQKIVTEISANGTAGIKYTTVTSGTSNSNNTVNLSNLHVARAIADGNGKNINDTYAKKSDPFAAYTSGSAITSLSSTQNNIVSCIKGLFADIGDSHYYYGIAVTNISISGDDRCVLTIDAAMYGFGRIKAVIPIPVKTNGVPTTGGSVDNPFFVRKVSETKWEIYVDFYDSSRFNYCYALIIGRNYYSL